MDNKRGILDMINKDSKKIEKNDNFYLWGTKMDVIYGFSDISFIGDKIYAKDLKQLEKYIATNMMKIVEDKVLGWYATFDECIPLPSLKIRKMTSRWGVCNTKTKTITLNYYLSKYDFCCLDYVIVHELSHFIHPNHSRDFWNLVGKYYPQYKECRRMLKE
jgi:predicted metal-dependent hydrolase